MWITEFLRAVLGLTKACRAPSAERGCLVPNRNGVLLVATLLGLVACSANDAVEVPALNRSEANLWAACTGQCSAYENCGDTTGDWGCLIDTDTGAHATCTPATKYCCQDLPCIHPPGDNTKYLYSPTPGAPTVCRTDWSCQPCPAGRVRDQADPTNPACCSPTWSCSGVVCGSVTDNCGYSHSCGSCPTGQTCSNNGTCCRLTQEQACGNMHCGTVSDGCGGTYTCGTCGNPTLQYCGSGNYCYCQYPYRNCENPLPARPSCYKVCP